MKLESNHGSSNGWCCFWCFSHFLSKILYIILLCLKTGPERMSGSGQTYLFNSNYNIDPSTMVIWHFNQRTNGPVNAHLISWHTKAQNIQNLENIW